MSKTPSPVLFGLSELESEVAALSLLSEEMSLPQLSKAQLRSIKGKGQQSVTGAQELIIACMDLVRRRPDIGGSLGVSPELLGDLIAREEALRRIEEGARDLRISADEAYRRLGEAVLDMDREIERAVEDVARSSSLSAMQRAFAAGLFSEVSRLKEDARARNLQPAAPARRDRNIARLVLAGKGRTAGRGLRLLGSPSRARPAGQAALGTEG